MGLSVLQRMGFWFAGQAPQLVADGTPYRVLLSVEQHCKQPPTISNRAGSVSSCLLQQDSEDLPVVP